MARYVFIITSVGKKKDGPVYWCDYRADTITEAVGSFLADNGNIYHPETVLEDPDLKTMDLTSIGLRSLLKKLEAANQLWPNGYKVLPDWTVQNLEPAEKLPEIPYEIHNTRPIDAERCISAVRHMCESYRH